MNRRKKKKDFVSLKYDCFVWVFAEFCENCMEANNQCRDLEVGMWRRGPLMFYVFIMFYNIKWLHVWAGLIFVEHKVNDAVN